MNLQLLTPTDREVVLIREFEASADLLFDAFTCPDMLGRWYWPRNWTLTVCDVDLRVGGAFRFVSRRPGGTEIGQRGIYREIVRGKRLVHTEHWEDWDAGESLVTSTFVAKDGKTTLTSTIRFPSRQVRDKILKSGLEASAHDLYDRLAECLGSSSASDGPAKGGTKADDGGSGRR